MGLRSAPHIAFYPHTPHFTQNPVPPALACACSPDDTLYQQRLRGINALYVAAGVIHLINALQYIYAWMPLGYGFLHPVMIPEYLNVLGAALYLWSASLYNTTITDYTYDAATKVTTYGPSVLRVHEIETASSLIEVFAAIGWCLVWAFTYIPGPGRGYTLDDPDMSGNLLILVPSIIYFVYNVQNLRDPSSYNDNTLYETGDTWYFVGAVFFFCSALRDDGWFPSFGLWPPVRAMLGAVGLGPAADAAVRGLYARCDRAGSGDKAQPLLDAEAAEARPLVGSDSSVAGSGRNTSRGVYSAWGEQ